MSLAGVAVPRPRLLEVRLPERDFPLLTLGFRGEHAVVHAADSHESSTLRRGDGAVPSDDVVEVLMLDELARFNGDFALTLEHAWRVLDAFIRSGSPGDPRDWCEL